MGTIKQNFANNIETSGKFDAQDLTGTIPAANIANASLSDITTVPPTATGGDLIQSVASDPPAPDFGDIWYNSTEQKIKLKALGAGSWASGGNLNTARYAQLGGAGTQTSALAFGGADPAGIAVANNEEYNGTSWTETTDLNTTRSQMGSTGQSPQTAAFGFGGDRPNGFQSLAESWNGSAWTETTDLNSARASMGAAGNQTAGLAFGGRTPPNNPTGITESWNGSAWTELNDMNTGRAYIHGSGTQTAAIGSGGYTPTAVTELWNGTSWTEVNDLNTGRGYLTNNGGTQTSTIVVGGYVSGGPYVANTETWNGTSWTEENDLNNATGWGGSAGTASSLLYFGGTPVAATTRTEEWTVATPNQSIQGS